jgi:hypothetical protein
MRKHFLGGLVVASPFVLAVACGGGAEVDSGNESEFGSGADGSGAESSSGGGSAAAGPDLNVGGGDSTVVTCEEHTDCPKGTFCGEDDECVTSKSGSPCADDDNCHRGESCVNGHCGCNAQLFEAAAIPPNVMIVFDRSASMRVYCIDTESGEECDDDDDEFAICSDGSSSCTTRWDIALSAIGDLIASAGDSVRFGLMLYPGTDQECDTEATCDGGFIALNPGETTSEDIQEYLDDTDTCGKNPQEVGFNTPTAEALTKVLNDDGLSDTERENYVLLVTDGDSICGSPDVAADPAPVATDLLNLDPSVKTFVVGFGSGISDDGEEELNGIAQNGDTALTDGPPYYFVADNADALAAALNEIAGSVLSCNYELSEAPKNLDELFVYLGMDQVERDSKHKGGWDYDKDTQQLIFYGDECDALKSGAADSLTIAYGCPPPDDVLK